MPDSANIVRVQVVVSGIVQGVGFRYFTTRAAKYSQCHGWVRNLVDGRVEAVAEGTAEQIASFLESIKLGPQGSHVDEVVVEHLPATGEFKNFIVRK